MFDRLHKLRCLILESQQNTSETHSCLSIGKYQSPHLNSQNQNEDQIYSAASELYVVFFFFLFLKMLCNFLVQISFIALIVHASYHLISVAVLLLVLFLYKL